MNSIAYLSVTKSKLKMQIEHLTEALTARESWIANARPALQNGLELIKKFAEEKAEAADRARRLECALKAVLETTRDVERYPFDSVALEARRIAVLALLVPTKEDESGGNS